MWFVADFLLAFVVIASVLGFHIGPHSHAAAGIAGVVAAIWLLTMAATGQAAPLLWVALGADVALTAGVGTIAWRGLQTKHIPALPLAHERLIGATGIAVSDLDPDGIVRVRAEAWSASSLNGRIEKGATVQVIEVTGIRLGVWGEDTTTPGNAIARLDPIEIDNNTIAGNSPDGDTTGVS
ncbi:MAG TPA: NfeD family protein [Acidimicrobiales bacterium]